MKDFFSSELWKWIKAAVQVFILFAVVLGILLAMQSAGLAERELEERFVLCMDRVNVRMGAGRNTCEIGWLECGDSVWVDGRKRNGYVHVVGLNLEAGEGWIHQGYLVEDKPVRMGRTARIVSKGRLAARKNVDGKRTRWLKSGAKLKVHWWSEEWCLTDCGYVKSVYLEMEEM